LGAIGSFYAFILHRTGRVGITVVARSNYHAVKDKGITIDSQNHGQHTFVPQSVVRTPAEAQGPFDYIVCAHKAINNDAVAETLKPAVDPDRTTIVIIQNGVGNEEPFRKAFPKSCILSCVTWTGGTQTSPGIVKHTKLEDLQIGLYPSPDIPNDVEQARLAAFTSLLSTGGTPFRVEDDIQVARWSKVVWNVAWNSITTLTMSDTQSWLASSSYAEPRTRKLMEEVVDVARACGVPLGHRLIDDQMEKIKGMAPIYSSMYVDRKEGRKMEVDVIFGVPVRKGRELGVSIPTLETIYALLLAVDSRLG
jgi:2-dehydropantoate 2-reductase